MFHFFGRTNDGQGNSLPNWQVELVDRTTSAVVPIFSDENSTPIISVSGIANRALSDAEGNYDFFVADGVYDRRIYNDVGVFQRIDEYMPSYGSGYATIEADRAQAEREAAEAANTSAQGAATTATTKASEAAASAAIVIGAVGPMFPVYRFAPRNKTWATPSGMLDPLNVDVECNGRSFDFTKDIHAENDWTTTGTVAATYYVSSAGSDSNTGTSEADAWLSLNKVKSSAVDNAVVYLLDRWIDYNQNTAAQFNLGSNNLKIIGHPQGTLISGWRRSYDTAFMSWTAVGNAYESSASFVPTTLYSMADRKFADNGIPLQMPHVATAALAQSTPGTWHLDTGTGTLTVHMLDDRLPDVDDDWIPVTSYSGVQILTDGWFVGENLHFAFHTGAGNGAGMRFRPTTTGVAAVAKLALKNCVSMCASGNAFEIYDPLVATMDGCKGGNAHFDIFNYSTFRSSGTRAQDSTILERNCHGHAPGREAGRINGGASGSNNVSTAHGGMHIRRVGLTGHTSDNSFMADVNGCMAASYGIDMPQSEGGGLFQNGYWYQKLTGQGVTDAKGILVGCSSGSVDSGKYDLSNWNDSETAASIGEIHVSDWLGSSAISTRAGTIVKDYETGATLLP